MINQKKKKKKAIYNMHGRGGVQEESELYKFTYKWKLKFNMKCFRQLYDKL